MKSIAATFVMIVLLLVGTSSSQATCSKLCEVVEVEDTYIDYNLLEKAKHLEVSNPERSIPFYLVATSCMTMMAEPPSLRTEASLEDLVSALVDVAGDESTRLYFSGMAKAVKYAQELVDCPDITGEDIRRLHYYILGNTEDGLSSLRKGRTVVSRGGFDLFDFVSIGAAIDAINLNRGRVREDFIKQNTIVGRILRTFCVDGVVCGEYLFEYYRYMCRYKQKIASLDSLAPLERRDVVYRLLIGFKEEFPTAASFLIDTRCTPPVFLDEEMKELCELLNATSKFYVGQTSFYNTLRYAENVFHKTALTHFFDDGNNRLARMLVAIVCARSGLHAPVMSADLYQAAVASHFSSMHSDKIMPIADAFVDSLYKMQLHLKDKPPFTIEDIMRGINHSARK